MIVLLDEPKTSEDYIYEYKNKNGFYKGTPFNTAGWTSVDVAGGNHRKNWAYFSHKIYGKLDHS